MTDQTDSDAAKAIPSKGFVAMLYLPLMVPAALPLYFAMTAEETQMVIFMAATVVGILVFNAIILVAAYRWLSRGAEE